MTSLEKGARERGLAEMPWSAEQNRRPQLEAWGMACVSNRYWRWRRRQ